jgi:hypothetical protein
MKGAGETTCMSFAQGEHYARNHLHHGVHKSGYQMHNCVLHHAPTKRVHVPRLRAHAIRAAATR